MGLKPLGTSVKIQISGSTPKDSDSAGLGSEGREDGSQEGAFCLYAGGWISVGLE